MATLFLIIFIISMFLYFIQRNKDLKTTGRVHWLTMTYLGTMIVSILLVILIANIGR